MSRLLVGLTALALLVVATTTAAPVPTHLMRKESPLYFPTRVGAKWVYKVDRKGLSGEAEATFSVTAVEQVDGGTLVSVTEHRPGGRKFLDKKMLVSRAGVTQIEGYEGKLVAPWCWLKIPCVVKDTWESDCSNDLFLQKWQCTTLGTEEVEVPAGKFTTVKVHSKFVSVPRGRGTFCIVDEGDVEWYAPGVGVVKCERGGIAPDWVLKSFTP